MTATAATTASGRRDHLDAEGLRAVVERYRRALREHEQRLNRLNVYPVPDGDTGTNMALTLESVVAELDGASDLPSTCAAIAQGSLMGARGNSGVILSQVLRGLTSCLRDAGTEGAGTEGVVAGLVAASVAADAAVLRPVEGTILTVARQAAEAARQRAGSGASTLEAVEAAVGAAEAALARTPELLPVLADAGVVDAGGAGYVLFLEALRATLGGAEVSAAGDHGGPEAADGAGRASAAGQPEGSATASPAGSGVAGLRYEVMFLLDAPDEAMEGFKGGWAPLGDSIVVVGGDGLWNCHIHTDDVGAAIEAALDAGRPRGIRVTDLAEQVAEQAWVREGMAGGPATAPPVATTTAETAVVAVGVGEGVTRILRSLGAAAVVVGGPSANPSTAELLAAVEGTGARGVVVLPDNGNVIAVAEQVVALASRPVGVVATRGVPEGLGALVGFDPAAALEVNLARMAEAAAGVAWGEVTWAVRDSATPAGPVQAGDRLGLAGDEVVVVGTEAVDVTCRLVEHLVTEDHELLTLLAGARADPGTTEAVVAALGQRRPGLAVEVYDGGQPLAEYLLGLE